MKCIVLDLYDSFQCMAGGCPSTCCAGWEIVIDAQAYNRFQKIESKPLRDEILSGISKKDGKYFFQNDKSGRCSMLDDDNLCHIQRHTDEKTLCNTCRKYPRLTNKVDDVLYLSMAASCPVVSNYLVNGDICWKILEKSGQKEKIKMQDFLFLESHWNFWNENEQIAKGIERNVKRFLLKYQCYEKMTFEILDVITAFQAGMSFLPLFEVFERELSSQEMIEKICCFEEQTQDMWKRVKNNYLNYRFLSLQMEFPMQESDKVVCQTAGELVLLRVLAFCEFERGKKLTTESLEKLLSMTYRFCGHGNELLKTVQKIFFEFFSEDFLWNYILD